MKKELKVGDLVWMDGYTSMAQQSAQEEFEIEKVDYRYDDMTGERFPVYFVEGEWYDGRDGSCYSNKNSMYYIEIEDHE